MLTAENAVTKMTIIETAARRDMERQRFTLRMNYLAAANLYMSMLGKPTLFDEDETDAQYETSRDLEDLHNALDAEYYRLYLTDGTEEA